MKLNKINEIVDCYIRMATINDLLDLLIDYKFNNETRNLIYTFLRYNSVNYRYINDLRNEYINENEDEYEQIKKEALELLKNEKLRYE